MWLPFFFFLFLTERSYLAAPKAAGPAVRSQASDGRTDSARLSRVDAMRRLSKKNRERPARARTRSQRNGKRTSAVFLAPSLSATSRRLPLFPHVNVCVFVCDRLRAPIYKSVCARERERERERKKSQTV